MRTILHPSGMNNSWCIPSRNKLGTSSVGTIAISSIGGGGATVVNTHSNTGGTADTGSGQLNFTGGAGVMQDKGGDAADTVG